MSYFNRKNTSRRGTFNRKSRTAQGFEANGANFREGDPSLVRFGGSAPTKSAISDDSQTLQRKAFRDLQNVGVIEVKADPNSAVIHADLPYPIFARTNPVTDARYPGLDNILGNSITRLQNATSNNAFLNAVDLANISLFINYRYYYLDTGNTTGKHNNMAYNLEAFKSYSEAESRTYSTMLTELPFTRSSVITNDSVPIPNGYTTWIGDTQNTNAVGESYRQMMALIHYQCVLQALVQPIAKYKQTRSLEQQVMNMSYRREAAQVSALFGLLKKAAFIAQLTSLGQSIIGDYFDLDWYRQVNTLTNVSSRKSNGMFDPLTTAVTCPIIPGIAISTVTYDPETYTNKTAYRETAYYDSDKILSYKGSLYNPVKHELDPDDTTYSLQQVIYYLCKMLDVSEILGWARKYSTPNPNPQRLDPDSPSTYYEHINGLIRVAMTMASKFVSSMGDIRTYLDRMSTSGMLYWQKGVYFDVTHNDQINPPYNMILNNVILNYVSGSAELTYNSDTQRWRAFTLWDKFEGIPDFDRKSGGAFITLSLRSLSSNLDPESAPYIIPIMFGPRPSYAATAGLQCWTRLGWAFDVVSVESTVADFHEGELARLDPLFTGIKVKVPTVNLNVTSGNAAEVIRLVGFVAKAVEELCGYCDVKSSGVTRVEQVLVDSNKLAFIDVELEDVTNLMITYARNYSPFRVMTPGAGRTMGFLGSSNS